MNERRVLRETVISNCLASKLKVLIQIMDWAVYFFGVRIMIRMRMIKNICGFCFFIAGS